MSVRKSHRWKTSVVGLGSMGRRHARVLSALHDRFDFVGWYDVRDLSWEAGPDANVTRLRDEDEAIDRAEVVVVATPIDAHASAAERALAAGRHVLVEKPLCATAAEAEALVARSHAGARLFVGQSERFNPVVRVLWRLVRDDHALAMDLQRVGPCRQSDYGALLNLGVHDFDLAAYLGGGRVELRAAIGEGDEMAHVLFSVPAPARAVGHLYVDRSAPARRRAIAIATRRWTYEGDLLGHRLVRAPRKGGARADVPLPAEEPLVAQAVALADALDAPDSRAARDIATGADGARAVALAERAARDVREYCAVPLRAARHQG